MPIILRKTKNAPLTIDELDGNFEDVDKRINDLNANLNKVIGVASVERHGNSLWFLSKTGDVIADVALPEMAARPIEQPPIAPPFIKLTIYDRKSLPAQCEIGQICLFMDKPGSGSIIFYDGAQWCNAANNQPLK